MSDEPTIRFQLAPPVIQFLSFRLVSSPDRPAIRDNLRAERLQYQSLKHSLIFSLLASFLFLHRGMAALHYGEYLIVSRPHLNPHLGVSIPYASALRRNDPFQYQQFTDLEKTFVTETEAEAYGFTVARTWIDHER